MKSDIRKSMLAMLFAAFLNPAFATTEWSWRFTASTLNIADSYSAYALIENSAASDAPIYVSGIALDSFGDHGILHEGDGKGPIVPMGLAIATWIAPGESAELKVLSFALMHDNYPTPGVAYSIRPSLSVLAGMDCDPPRNYLGCTPSTKLSENSLIVSFAPVPEPGTLALFAAGAVALIGSSRISRR